MIETTNLHPDLQAYLASCFVPPKVPDTVEGLKTLRVGIYCRISADDEKEGKGVARQKADGRRLQCDKYPNASSIEYYIDNDISAVGGKERPAFERLLVDMAAGRLDVVIMWHTDRLYRKIEDLTRIMKAWEANQPFMAAVTIGFIDFTTPTGRFLAKQLAIIGELEVERIIERVRRKKQEMREEGRPLGGARAFGYAADGYEVNGREAARMRIAARRILVGGQTEGDIAREWNRRGVKTARGTEWDAVKVRRVLCRWRNIGIVEHEGQPVGPAQWKPILDEVTFVGLRKRLLGKATRPQKPRGESLLANLARCGECGAVLWGAGEDPRGNLRLRCSRSHHLKRIAKPIELYVEERIIAILSRPDAISLLGKGPSEDSMHELHAAAAARQATLAEASAMFADGEIDRDQLRDITTKARAKLVEIEKQLADVTAGSVLDGLIGVVDVVERWRELDLDRRRAVIDHLVEVKVHRGATGGDRRSKRRAARFASTIEVTPKAVG